MRATLSKVTAPPALSRVRSAWSLLQLAFTVSLLVRSAGRTTALIVISANLAGAAVNLWNAVQAPGDWVNYFAAAGFLLILLAWWLVSRWVRTKPV